MKTLALIAAAAMTLGVGTATAASAQRSERVVHRTTVVRHVEHHNRGWRTKRICTVRWNHHRRVRNCRTIRVRRY